MTWLRIDRYADEAANFSRIIEKVNVEIIARFTIDGEPASKARARFTRAGWAYTPEKTRSAEEEVAATFRQVAPDHIPDATHDYGLACVFFAGTYQRRDVDNMLKLISDGLNKVAWDDDVQVVEVMGRRGFDRPSNARTEVLVYRLGPRQFPTKPCEQCHQPMRVYNSTSAHTKYCSADCRDAARKARHTGTCIACGKQFTKDRTHPIQTCSPECRKSIDRTVAECSQCGQQFARPKSWMSPPYLCGHECQVAYWAARRTPSPKGACIDCGGPVSRREYQRCRSCSVAHRGANKRSLTTFGESA